MNAARGYACEYVAWQFISTLTPRDTIDYLLYELPPTPSPHASNSDVGRVDGTYLGHAASDEEAPLLRNGRDSSYFGGQTTPAGDVSLSASFHEFTAQFENLSALEIAIVSDSKKFLSQRPVKNIINGLWRVRTTLKQSTPHLF